jgi:hypothetical protein
MFVDTEGHPVPCGFGPDPAYGDGELVTPLAE